MDYGFEEVMVFIDKTLADMEDDLLCDCEPVTVEVVRNIIYGRIFAGLDFYYDTRKKYDKSLF